MFHNFWSSKIYPNYYSSSFSITQIYMDLWWKMDFIPFKRRAWSPLRFKLWMRGFGEVKIKLGFALLVLLSLGRSVLGKMGELLFLLFLCYAVCNARTVPMLLSLLLTRTRVDHPLANTFTLLILFIYLTFTLTLVPWFDSSILDLVCEFWRRS